MKIANLKQAIRICNKLRKEGKKTVLVGGVFDILHYGHLKFLQAAKKEGDVLIVALESDINVRRRKGEKRPLHSEQARAEMLAAVEYVDYVIVLPEMHTKDYYKMVEQLKPDVIAVTENDPQIANKRQQAESVGGKLKAVTPRLPTPSTTQLAKILEVE